MRGHSHTVPDIAALIRATVSLLLRQLRLQRKQRLERLALATYVGWNLGLRSIGRRRVART